jgi:hypothetical protein
MYVPACQHHDRACAGCGRQLAWTWPGRGAVRAQHAVHCSRGPARTLGFIIYIYQQVCRLWCVHFIRTSDMARFGRLPLKNCRRLSLGHRSRCARRRPPAAALVKKNRLPLKNCSLRYFICEIFQRRTHAHDTSHTHPNSAGFPPAKHTRRGLGKRAHTQHIHTHML